APLHYRLRRCWIKPASELVRLRPFVRVIAPSFDHFIGQQKQSGRNLEPKGLRGLEVNRKPELNWLLYRQVGYLRTFQYPTYIDAGQSMCVRNIRIIAH